MHGLMLPACAANEVVAPMGVERQVAPHVRIAVACIGQLRGRRRRKTVARYGQAFKSKTEGRLQPPESATAEAREAGIGVGMLERGPCRRRLGWRR